MPGVSSARPRDLRTWVTKSRAEDNEIRGHIPRLTTKHDAFVSEVAKWPGASFNASALIADLQTWIRLNEEDARWVGVIATEFERAGGTGDISRLSNSVIQDALDAAGLKNTRADVTFDSPTILGGQTTSGFANDPVNTASGNFVEAEVDIAFEGGLSALRFQRVYNSRSDSVGGFGTGWSSWATTRLREEPDGAHLESIDGQRLVFNRSPEGFDRTAGAPGVVEGAEEGLSLKLFGGGRWDFDSDGLPLRTYEGTQPQLNFRHEDGRLVEIAHARGPALTLSWDGDRVVSLVSTDGRLVEYGYDENGDLTTAVGPEPRTYELEDGRVVSITDADGVVAVKNLYDDEGRVLEQESAHGRRTRMRYLPGRVAVVDDHDGEVTNTFIHDDHGRLIAAIDGNGERIARSYDTWGNPISLTDRRGATTSLAWDENGRLMRRVLPSGASFDLSYDEEGRLVEVTCSNGAATRLAYADSSRIPSEIVDPEGGVTRATIEDGVIVAVTDPDGVVMRFEHDAFGNVTRVTDGAGNARSIERDGVGRPTRIVSAEGRATEMRYDAAGRIVQRSSGDGHAWTYQYTLGGRMAAIIDPLGARRESRYGTHGGMVEVSDASGTTTTRRFDRFGNVVGVQEPDGATWHFTYDRMMSLSEVLDPGGGRWTIDRDVEGDLLGSVDPTGRRTRATRDALGRIDEITDGVAAASFRYDELGRGIHQARPDGSETIAGYDLCGRCISLTFADGGVIHYSYSKGGRLSQMTDQAGRTSRFEYDSRGLPIAAIDPAGARWSYEYDRDGLLTEVKAPTGETETTSYDGAGRISGRRGRRGTHSYGYDPAGRLTTVSDALGAETSFEYDAAGHIVGVTDPNGGTSRYSHNDRGQVVSVTDPMGGVLRWDYDALGRIVCEVDQIGRETKTAYDEAGRVIHQSDGARSRIWSYDASGRVATLSVGGEEIRVERDSWGRPTRVTDGTTENELRWDAVGRVASRRRNEQTVEWAYDEIGRKTGIRYPDGSEVTYTYDTAAVTLHHPSIGDIRSTYDASGRLIAREGVGFHETWQYTEGNLGAYSREVEGDSETIAIVRDAARRVVGVTADDGSGRRFSYDAAGQLIASEGTDGSITFRYDANGRLIAEDDAGQEVRYEYDAAAQLLERTVGDAVTRFTYDDAGRRIREADGRVVTTYEWGGRGYLTSIRREGQVSESIEFAVDALGELARIDGQDVMWDTASPVAMPLVLGDSNVIGVGTPFATVAGNDLRPVSEPQAINPAEDAWGLTSAVIGEVPQLAYRGEIQVGGLVWLRNRPYDPRTRCFLTTDPLRPLAGSPTTFHPYNYAANDPVSLVDPLGLRPMTHADLKTWIDESGYGYGLSAKHLVGAALVVGSIVLIASGVGAGPGMLLLYGTLSGAAGAAGMNLLQQGHSTMDWGSFARATAVGAITGAVFSGGVGTALIGKVPGGGAVVSAASKLGGPTMSGKVIRGGIQGASEGVSSGAIDRALDPKRSVLDPEAILWDAGVSAVTGTTGTYLGNKWDEWRGPGTDLVPLPPSKLPVPYEPPKLPVPYEPKLPVPYEAPNLPVPYEAPQLPTGS